MIIKSKYKIARRLGASIYEKTQTQKFAARAARKGKAHETKKGGAKTDYGIQMLEKQKVRYTYGVNERQFGNYVAKAVAKQGVNNVEALYSLLESRLDNVVYRSGIAPTRLAARQMVSHGHITVNGKRVSIPSYSVVQGEKISIREASKSKPLYNTLPERLKEVKVPAWIKLDTDTKVAEVTAIPKTSPAEMGFNLGAVIEFYSR